MIARPCLACGEPITAGSYCRDCTPADKPRPEGHVHTNTTKWKKLSQRLRKLQNYCDMCGSTERLTVDHILPVSDYEELAYAVENLRVLCHTDNSRRGDRYTQAEADAVIARLEEAYKRRPTRKGRERIEAARRASDQGLCGQGAESPPDGKPQGALHTSRRST
ncbi:HNH endonuclease signature motif containing protein [Mycobacterium sp. 852002-51961_SCH5331710]|uniref:HNH endonuclease signature motif containing protein n=1 Tax=Mycobacterium sp. 852002-51961_SCH5331710 TaxID=1834105 RepID=UPI0007FEFA2E|nr:HNH endonuclease signature motif containing protein [Mycobacterium sp. 852002-51961_SCH5331710]OBB42702.1 hypothetical protein A5752_06205 [Mycobacterium sp. 852002-51961_SCH5331710]